MDGLQNTSAVNLRFGRRVCIFCSFHFPYSGSGKNYKVTIVTNVPVHSGSHYNGMVQGTQDGYSKVRKIDVSGSEHQVLFLVILLKSNVRMIAVMYN